MKDPCLVAYVGGNMRWCAKSTRLHYCELKAIKGVRKEIIDHRCKNKFVLSEKNFFL